MQLRNNTIDVLNPIVSKIKQKDGHMRVCFLLTHVPNPRMNKRIEVFKNISVVWIICARRASQNIWEPTQTVEHIIFDIDLPGANHILKRYWVSQNFQKKVMERLEVLKPDVIYAEGLDCLIIADKYKRNHNAFVFFEVADLRESFIVRPRKTVNRIISNAILCQERTAFRSVDHLVVTSPQFYDMHYRELIGKDKVLFIPNAPDIAVFKNYRRKDSGNFTVGFIGGIRYLQQMKMLVDVSSVIGCDVLFAGAGGTSTDCDEITKYCVGKHNVTFTGKYQYEKEIAGLYGKVNCVFAVYDADNPNVRIALPNKLYESIICELPIIVAKGTYLAELVEQWGVGIAVSHKSPESLTEALHRLKTDPDYYHSFVANCRELKSQFLDNSWEKNIKKIAEQK